MVKFLISTAFLFAMFVMGGGTLLGGTLLYRTSGGGDSKCSGRPIFFYWRKTESNIILLERNLPIDSGVRQWSHSLMIPLNCLWAEWNNRMRGQLNVTWLDFAFVLISFFHMYGAVVVPYFAGEGEGGFV